MKKKKNNKIFIIIFLVLVLVYQNNIHYDLYRILTIKFEKRLAIDYGNCDKYGLGFINYSLEKINKNQKIGIFNENDLPGIRWKFDHLKKLDYLNNLKNSSIKDFDYLILLSMKKRLVELKLINELVYIDNVKFQIKNNLNNCFLLKRYD